MKLTRAWRLCAALAFAAILTLTLAAGGVPVQADDPGSAPTPTPTESIGTNGPCHSC